MKKKSIVPCIYLFSGQAVAGFKERNVFECKDVQELAGFYSDNGADELLVFDLSGDDPSHEEAIANIKQICSVSEVPVTAAGNIKRMEDVKKLIYAGCARAVLNFSKESNIQLLEEVSKKFGKEKIAVCVAKKEEFSAHQQDIETYASLVICLKEILQEEVRRLSDIPILLLCDRMDEEQVTAVLESDGADGVTGAWVSALDTQLMQLKTTLKEKGIAVNSLESSIPWSEFKKNSDDMVPVVVQDYKTDEVLMVAYMNEEAFNTTLETGKMTYYSRSRNELWTKGMTSGHVQYVKSLSIDCDKDTILAKVSQVGAACHTGNRSCFFTELVRKEYKDSNPLHVFQNVYNVILDRKIHPKDGSYTNYLFDKGIDKILKKVGEECTEIVIAAKNPDREEIKYEISDFLYHVMVLMAEKGVTWEDITSELEHRS